MTDDSGNQEASDPTEGPGEAGGVAERLARDFLRAAPGAFFRSRALQLMRAGRAEEQPVAWPETALGAEVVSHFPGEAEIAGDVDADSVLIIDSFMLSHHAGECLLRHILGIYDSRVADVPTSAPWLHMVALQAGPFRRRVEELTHLDTSARTELVKFLFMPDELAAADQSAQGQEDAERARIFCRAWLTYFATRFLDSARGYNAAKHGLTPLGGPVHLSFYPGPEPPDLSVDPSDESQGFAVLLDGPALRTLEHESDGNGGKTWFQVTRAVDPAALISTTLVAADLLDWLWSVERNRVTGQGQMTRVRMGPLPTDIRGRNLRAWSSMKMPLAAFTLREDDQNDEQP